MRTARLIALSLSLLGLTGGGLVASVPARSLALLDCGVTTLEGTVVESPDADDILECGPPQPIVVRQELAAAKPGREATRSPLATFFALSDFQYVDEESPLRGEWADKCEEHPATSAFRPHETMVGQLMEAHVRGANRIAARGGPILGGRFDLTLALGDLADNQQYNETRFFIDLLDGGRLLNPDSGQDPVLGGDGYDGVQGVDPIGAPSHPLTSPVPGVRMVELANERFLAEGLRNADGSRIPWYTVLGNHDMKVQGTIADDNQSWRALVRQYVRGHTKVMDLDADKQQQACAGGFSSQEFWTQLLTACSATPASCGGNTRVVPADEDRRLLDKADWIKEHFKTTGRPVGHGFGADFRRCPAEPYPDYAPRGCYTFDQGQLRFIVLDTNPAEGLQEGNIDEAQFKWIEQELKAASRSHLDAQGNVVHNPNGSNRLVVIVTHHTVETTTNTGPRTGQDPGSKGTLYDGGDLRDLLLRFPNVILQMSGHSHQNKIWAHRNAENGTGYWEVNTASVADHPTQSRTIEIADNGDGTLSIFAVTFDAAVPPNPRDIDWVTGDHTHETQHGEEQNINEDWLASAGREIQYHDPQQTRSKLGAPEDRNVELIIGRPFQVTTPRQVAQCVKAGAVGATPVLGTTLKDTLFGTAGPDVICGFGKGDIIGGLGGNDVIFGGPGRDQLQGGSGNDRIHGGPGPDSLNGQRGRDLLAGGAKSDRCRGGPARDRLRRCESEPRRR
jgi:metallophosphoesterase (TIGR03767 family)